MYTAAGTIDTRGRVAEFAPLVRRLAHHLAARLPPSVQIDDIIQAGMIGLMDAVSRFDEFRGNQFETYATQRIRGAMLDEVRSNDWLPRSTRRSLKRIEEAMRRLQQRLGRAPTETEIAAELGVPLEEYQSMLQEARGCELLHLEDFSRDGDDDYLDRNISDDNGQSARALPGRPVSRGADRGDRAVAAEREKLLMGLYYEQELNFKEIAAVLEVSRITRVPAARPGGRPRCARR